MTWQTKTIIFSIPQCLWSLNLSGWAPAQKVTWPFSHAVLWNQVKSLWQPKIIMSPPPNFTYWWLAMRGFHSQCYYTLWLLGLLYGLLYLRCHNIYGHKTRQDPDLPWLPLTHKVKWLYNHVVFWEHVTN